MLGGGGVRRSDPAIELGHAHRLGSDWQWNRNASLAIAFQAIGSLHVVAVELLSVVQTVAFGWFVGEPSQNDLERFFYHDDSDQQLI